MLHNQGKKTKIKTHLNDLINTVNSALGVFSSCKHSISDGILMKFHRVIKC